MGERALQIVCRSCDFEILTNFEYTSMEKCLLSMCEIPTLEMKKKRESEKKEGGRGREGGRENLKSRDL